MWWYFCLKWRMYDLMWIKSLEVDPGPQILSSAFILSFSIWLASKSGHSLHAVSDKKKKQNSFPSLAKVLNMAFVGQTCIVCSYLNQSLTASWVRKCSLARHGSGVHSWKKGLESVPPNHMNWEWWGRVMWGEKVLHQKLEMLDRESNC